MMLRPLDLKKIIANRLPEISTMTGAIKGDSGSALWTSQMRAATRGGKCTIKPVEEPSDRE
jgi:hypothetical protein